MTARTFREPSPHRPSTSSGPGDRRHSPIDVPPLPSLPTKFVPQNGSGRRAVSMEPSMRSPPASPRRSGAPTGVDRGQPGSPTHNRIASLGTVPENDRPSSRNSINFSYPMGSRPISPTSPVENRTMTLDPASVRESPDEGSAARQTVPERSGNTKSRVSAAGNAEENPALKAAGIAAGTALAAATLSLQKNSPRADTGHAKAERVEQGTQATGSREQRIDRSVPLVDSGSGSEQPSSRAGLERWPSTVHEETEPKEEVDASVSTTQHPGRRWASASPAVDHREVVSTPQPSPQPSPKASRDTTPQQDHLHQSSSPGRSARFAKWLSVTAAGDQVHEPPPRSISPIKSALKHPRGNSLSPDRKVSIGGRVVQPPSEISDGTSVASDEGSRLGVKKRPVKVSFDDDAEVVGVAASPPTSPEEYVPESPPNKGKSRMSWLGVGKKRVSPLDYVTGDHDFDEVMRPRPALPSFGSVRGNRDGGHPAPAIPEFSDNESTSSSDNDIVSPGLSFSNDHALGGMLPMVQQKEPTQPNAVTTLEQLSVTGASSLYQQQPKPEPEHEHELDGVALGNITEQPPSSSVNAHADLLVPAIAIEPATPPVDSDQPIFGQRSSLECRIPGGYPPSSSDRNLKGAATTGSTDTTKSQPIATAVPHLDDVDTEGESGDSVYSDAAEDIDGDGFGSINAIVDSGPIPRSTGSPSQSRDATPKAADRITAIDNHSQDVTDQAREDPRSITPTQDSVNLEISESPITPSSNRGFESAYPPLPLKSKLRASSDHDGTGQTAVNKQRRPLSLAIGGDSHLRDPHTLSTDAKGKNRPVSLGAPFQMKKPNGTSPGIPESLGRTMSNGSDSSSSFKRSSHSTRSDGPFSMRRTMRGSSTQPQQSSFSGRADSPEDHRPLSSGSGAGTLRKTLRSPGAGNERYSFFSTNNKAPRAKFTKAPPKSMRGSRFVDSDGEGNEAPAQGFRSRFADSSDEDEPGSNTMRPVRGIPRRQGIHDGDSTDLDDSSEEERRQAAAVSARQSNLVPPGSRDKNSPNMSGFAAVAKQRGMTQRELEEFIMQPPRGRKPGLLTRLGLKKSKNPDHRIRKADVESPSRRDTPLERSRLEREQLRGEPFTNGVNEDRVVTTVSADPPEPTSPRKLGRRLSKRNTTGGEHWPLRTEPRNETPEPIPSHSQSLPSSPLQTSKAGPPAANAERNGSITANGGEGAGAISTIKEEPELPQAGQAGQAGLDINDARSDITNTTAEEPGLSARDVVIAGSGRKKRFPLLRKAFGLRK
ncbi:uncharacterized protein N7473_003808 [Penicillium subrubescens]|nr:uncharacterized protein N7473_003808 [Penicillium subrubescens]KAJ5906892.1 hypothetical protein N7473_003808 [Penicillium subrubescens]